MPQGQVFGQATYSPLMISGPNGEWKIDFRLVPQPAIACDGRRPTMPEVMSALRGTMVPILMLEVIEIVIAVTWGMIEAQQNDGPTP